MWHSVIHAAMRWAGRTPVSSSSKSAARQSPDLDWAVEANAVARSVGTGREQLGDLALRGIKRFTYVYDTGDNWASRRLQ
jgi:hypothetical protein